MAKRVVKDPEQAARILEGLALDLGGGGRGAMLLSETYADETLKAAVQLAAKRPTPQAPMASRTLTIVRQAAAGFTIRATRGSREEIAVGWGSEHGAGSKYPQFGGKRRRRGFWLRPAASRQSTFNAVADTLDKVVADGLAR